MVDTNLIVLLGAILLGSLSTIYSYKSIKFSIKENKEYLQNRFYGLLLLSLGFIVHSIGDFFSENIEMGIESLAHIIIFFSFIFLIRASHKILKNAKVYWLK